MVRLCTDEKMKYVDNQETTDTHVKGKNQGTTEKESIDEKTSCHDMADRELQELADENTSRLDEAKYIYSSCEPETKTNQCHDERNLPPSLGSSVDDHLAINQLTSESEKLNCMASTSENGKPDLDMN